MTNKTLHTQKYCSPCGEMMLGAVDGMLCLCKWVNDARFDRDIENMLKRIGAHERYVADGTTDRAKRQLDEYFAQRRRTFDLPLMPVGTEFRKRVWNSLRLIPYGQTITYAEEAVMTGCDKAVRAVAGANRENPLAIIVPCHRVIGSNGKLTGYAGGLMAKQYLLELEASQPTLFR